MHDETGELEAMEDAVDIGMVHVFVGDDDIVLAGHVVSEIVVHYKPE